MKCINKRISAAVCMVLSLILGGCSALGGGSSAAEEYEQQYYNKSLYQDKMFASDLCVTDTDVSLKGYAADESLHAAGLFDLKSEKVLYADKIHEKLFPASTTKIMTAYLTLKYGNLDDIVTVGSDAVQFSYDEQVCGLQAGDTVTLYDLLCGLVLYSGNDSAVAIAEYLGGSMEGFADMMNREANALGATNTHFVNPHGLQNDNHYTTAYDLYLMFNACTKDQRFLDIISMDSYTGTLKSSDQMVRTVVWTPTNYYSQGLVKAPSDINIFGGKTGTTDEAGSCVILYSRDMENNPYISIMMGAPDKDILYSDMTSLLTIGIPAP
ncbi:D-alanyl-D-alanine carboxypeptidase family protein [Clostridium sp. C105KSO13]|uniref:D-alanyl-D-alanine carboxypeptidase family protein n=1 Tax=Clostridium sp. C105KSO13 TaxID=1776045 RepID=UPI000740768F|nr:D-alanyl-D-alanine carboxypeptidase DacB precursor [Clostridium sp. C105KSO13]